MKHELKNNGCGETGKEIRNVSVESGSGGKMSGKWFDVEGRAGRKRCQGGKVDLMAKAGSTASLIRGGISDVKKKKVRTIDGQEAKYAKGTAAPVGKGERRAMKRIRWG